VRGDGLDRALSAAIREGLCLSTAEEDALWEGFAARVRWEAQAWAFFMAAMVRTSARLRPASLRSSWANRSYSARQ